MHRVINVEAKPGYVLALTFNDGTQGEVSIANNRLFGPMLLPLKDPAYFRQVRVDAYGAVCWPNEADLATDELYRKVKGIQ